jgi:hypothetical protein
MHVALPERWLAKHPQTRHLLEKEADHWAAAGYRFARTR